MSLNLIGSFCGSGTNSFGVMNGPSGTAGGIFTYELNSGGNVTYASAAIEVPAKHDRKEGFEHKVALYDGFYMRNLDG